MAKDLTLSILLDFYGNALTEKQRDAIDLYYNEDLSLAEIAEHVGITRQGVRDNIKRGEATLYEFEKKFKLAERSFYLEKGLEEISYQIDMIASHNDKHCYSGEISDAVKMIRDVVETLNKT